MNNSRRKNKKQVCTQFASKIIFSDAGKDPMDHLRLMTPSNEQQFKPASGSLNNLFRDAPANGEWTLELYDSKADGGHGKLIDWKLQVAVTACKEEFIWTRKNDPFSPDFFPRYGHTSVTIGKSIFLIGGYAGRKKSPQDSMLRYDYDDDVWIRLQSNSQNLRRSTSAGRASSLTPWGVVTFGGMNVDNDGSIQEDGVWRYNVIDGVWSSVDVLNANNIPSQFEAEKRPMPRYLGASAFLDLKDKSRALITDGAAFGSTIIIQFGGNSETHFLRDMWSLTLNGMKTDKMAAEQHDNFCEWRTKGNALNQWLSSCGHRQLNETSNDDPSENAMCSWEDVIMMAWCAREYQSFVFPT